LTGVAGFTYVQGQIQEWFENRPFNPMGDKRMVERTALRKLIFVGILTLMPVLVMGCAQSVTQSERDKTAQQATDGAAGVTMLIGAQKLPPPPPPAPGATPAQKLTTPASYMNR
jgi:hypothetical protein